LRCDFSAGAPSHVAQVIEEHLARAPPLGKLLLGAVLFLDQHVMDRGRQSTARVLLDIPPRGVTVRLGTRGSRAPGGLPKRR